MDNYTRMIVKAIDNNIREYKRLTEECALSDVIHKVSITSDYLKGLKDDNNIDNTA